MSINDLHKIAIKFQNIESLDVKQRTQIIEKKDLATVLLESIMFNVVENSFAHGIFRSLDKPNTESIKILSNILKCYFQKTTQVQ